MLLTGRTALVTGATQGIGRAIAARMAAEGARVVGCGRSVERGEAVAAEIRAAGGDAHFIACDVGEEEQVRSCVTTAAEHLGGLDILVNNAGPTDMVTTGLDGSVIDLPTDRWERLLRVSVGSVFWCCKYTLPLMRAAGAGAVCNIASVSGLFGESGLDGYTAGKGAMVALTRSLAVEFGGHGVRVNALAPGFVPGDNAASQAFIRNEVISAAFRSAQVLPDWGRAEDIAAVAAWICSDQARFVTGVVLPVDGGSTCRSPMPDLAAPEFLAAFADAQSS